MTADPDMTAIHSNDLEKVFAITFVARNQWKHILLKLGISGTVIESIRVRCHDVPKDCYYEGLTEWLKSGERSWGDLIEALTSPAVGHNDLARMIERDYIQSPSDTNSSKSIKLQMS